jgi:hypothetical protein
MHFFREIHVSLQLSRIGIFRLSTGYIHLEIPKLQEVFLSKTNTIFIGTHVLDAAASNIDCFLGKIHVFLQLS